MRMLKANLVILSMHTTSLHATSLHATSLHTTSLPAICLQLQILAATPHRPYLRHLINTPQMPFLPAPPSLPPPLMRPVLPLARPSPPPGSEPLPVPRLEDPFVHRKIPRKLHGHHAPRRRNLRLADAGQAHPVRGRHRRSQRRAVPCEVHRHVARRQSRRVRRRRQRRPGARRQVRRHRHARRRRQPRRRRRRVRRQEGEE